MMLDQTNELEYEAEALSILSRFNEAGLQLVDDNAARTEVAVGIVSECMDFWFTLPEDFEPEPIARDLLMSYCDLGEEP